MKVNGSLVFDASSASEVQNLRVQKYAGTGVPAYTSADTGRLIFASSSGTSNGNTYSANTIYFGSASANNWVAIATGGNAAALQTEVDAIETSLGAIVNSSGVFQVGAVTGAAVTGTETTLTQILQSIVNYANSNNELSELDDVTLTGLANKDLLQYNGTTWVNHAIGAASGVQAFDAGLDALAAKTTTGIVVQTGNDTFSSVSLVAPAQGITISNPSGVGGNITFALANDLAAIEGLTTAGYVVRTGDGTATTRVIAGTAGNVVVTNGSGVTSDTSIDLAPVTQATTGSFSKISLDGFGRVTGNTPVVVADITGLVDSVYVNVSGDTMTGNLNMGGNKILAIASPTADTDAANKAYVDAVAAGLSWKTAVKVATTGNVALATGGLLTVDGVVLVDGDRVLVKNQTAPAENGIYVAHAGAWVRATDSDSASELDGESVFVQQGTAAADTAWVQTASNLTVGTTALTYSQFSGSQIYSFGTGLGVVGNTVSVLLGAGIAALPSAEVGLDLFNTTTGALILTDNGTTRNPDSASQLHLLTGASSGLAQSAAGLYIAPTGVTNAMLLNDHVGLNGDSGTSTLALGQTLQIIGTSAAGISTSVAGQTVTITAADATSTSKGVAKFNSVMFGVVAGNVSIVSTLGTLGLTNVSSTVDSAATGDLLSYNGTKYTNVDRTTIAGTIKLGDLQDVGTADPTAHGQVVVANGTSFNTQKIYHLETVSVAATTWSVSHNLGQQFCVVTVVDSTNEVVIPQSITFDSTNGLTVTFNTAITGKVVVMGIA